MTSKNVKLVRFFWLCCFGLLLEWGATYAQALQPSGQFLQDTIKIGEPLRYSLSFSYPAELEVVFPGEDHSFQPFEYIDRSFVPTQTDSATSYDSVVYTLMTFELDSLQSLALPIYVIAADEEGNPDSTVIYSAIDSVYLQQLITELPDSVNLKENTAYLDVPLQFNYPYLLIGLGIFFVILLIVYLVFGEKIRKYLKLRRLQRNYKRFQEQFGKQIDQLERTPNEQESEHTLLLWKRYMERLERAPYTKMTTKEIIRLPEEETLAEDLRAIDRSIYGHRLNGELIAHFQQLEKHTRHRYEQRYRDIKHGRSNR
jgi:hypothetical protein